MLDIKYIRENTDAVKKAARDKGVEVDIDKLLQLDDEVRKSRGELDESNRRRNELAEEGAKAGPAKGKPSDENIKEGRRLKDEAAHLQVRLDALSAEFRELMLQVPNVPDGSVPTGTSDADNQEVRAWGDIPKFDFPSKDYMQLLGDLDLADLERGAKVSGFRGYFLKNEAVRLSFALWQLTLERLIKKGFVPMATPVIAREFNFVGTGWLPQGKDEVYRVGDDEYLIGTAEVSVMGYHADEILSEDELPKKYIAFSPCFRSEAGSYGKDTKGILRVHEFFKMEQVVLCRNDHEESVKWHEEITKNAEELVQELELPYRVVVNCAGDLGLGQVKKYDIECWVPSQNKYRETHSSSYFNDFQTRRLNIRYRDGSGEMRFAHSLNNTALATPRILIAILENYQTEDGTVSVPKVLRPYMGGMKEIKR